MTGSTFLSRPGRVHAAFIPAEPPRSSRLALWHRDPEVVDALESLGARGSIDVVIPGDVGVERVEVDAVFLPMAAAIDWLMGSSNEMASTHALARVVRSALGLVARGLLQPSVSDDGTDRWVVSPLTSDDLIVRSLLVTHLPPSAHCIATGVGAERMQAAAEVVHGLIAAVVDSMPRTPGAAVAVDQVAWATGAAVDVSRLRSRLAGTEVHERVTVGLRVIPPLDEGLAFTCEVQVRSTSDPAVISSAAQLWAGEVDWVDRSAELEVLRTLRRGAERWKPLERLLELPEPVGMELDDSEAMELLANAASGLTMAGLEILVPAALTRSLRAHATVDSSWQRDGVGGLDLSAVVDLTWRATVDGEPVSEEELQRLADAQRPVVKLRGEWVVVDAAVISRIGRRDTLRASDALAAALGGFVSFDGQFVEVDVAGPIADLAERVRSAGALHDAVDPFGLNATLRPYQRRGVAWIDEMARLRLGGVLADDMGLGKTIQVIATLLRRLDDPDVTAIGPTLVVCPASVVANWQREITRFAPSLRCVAYVGLERSLPTLGADDVVVTTYGLARRDIDELVEIDWQLVVADEAQHIKNPTSATARAMRRFTSGSRLAMTGTPVENRLADLWALLDWTTPGLLGSLETFRRRIAIPIERDRDPLATERFARLIAPFVLRRRKDDPDIVPELPPKTETVHPVVLSAEQAGLYRAVSQELMVEIEAASGLARRGLVFKLLTALKQICNHPAQYLKQEGPLEHRSGKLEAFDELVDAICDAGDSVLVFTQYVVMGNLLSNRLRGRGIDARFLDGSTPLDRRADLVDRFQEREFQVFIISLKAGGTGLNLTAATHVIHYDRWWNPAVENQASDRAWRIGQDRPVQIHQLICEGTLEERIAELLDEKRALADAVVGAGEAWLAELTNDDLAELVELGVQA